jgi:hypothetical protein
MRTLTRQDSEHHGEEGIEIIVMNNYGLTIFLSLLCVTMFVGLSAPPMAQKAQVEGTYTLNEAESDDINKVIDDAVGTLNFLERYTARGRLKKLNPVYSKVSIASTSNELSVTVDSQPALRTPANGTPVAWVGPDGRKVNVSMQLANGHLVQTFSSADGRRLNDYTLDPDGRTLTMQVTETSSRLPKPIKYKQVYKRV